MLLTAVIAFVVVLASASIGRAQNIDDLKKGVVKITAQVEGMTRTGTGFIVRVEKDVAYIVTAAHVVQGDPQPRVTFFSQQETPYPGAVRNAEGGEERGMALLMVKAQADFLSKETVLPLNAAVRLSGGESILTIGFPQSGGSWAVIKGDVVSREGRKLNINANIQEGNSGGPIIHNGQVVGLVAALGNSFGLGVTAKSVQDYLEGFNVTPQGPGPSAAPTTQSTSTGGESLKPSQSALVRELTGKDGAPMVLIPAGTFMMGSTKDEVDRVIKDCVKELKRDQATCEGWYKAELPRHKVRMDEFYLDKYEVTNQIFQQFVEQTGHQTTAEKEGSAKAFVEGKGWQDMKGASWRQPEGGQTVFASDRSEHPVVSVSWHDADAFCRWADKRLPTEAECEYATHAGTTTRYWWGNGSPGSRQVENIADETAKNLLSVIMTGYDDGSLRTAPVGSYEANPWRLQDMSGNVAEWTADWYDATYYKTGPERNPPGPSSGQYRVLRGGSWGLVPDNVRSAVRTWITPSNRYGSIGFRCAQDRPK